MLQLPPPEHPGMPATLGTALREGVPRAYATIFFSNSERLGWWLIAVTMLAPDMGVSGLGGVIVACALGWWLGFDRDQLRSGHLLFNSMLACNTVAWLDHGYGFSVGMFAAMWFLSACGALLLSVSLGAFFSRVLGLGAHSLPAVGVSYVLYFVGWSLAGPFQMAGAARGDLLDLTMAPPLLRAVCQGFGAMLFMPLALPGLLVMLGVALQSRLTLVAAITGFASGFAGMRMLGYSMEPMTLLWCGFNFLLCGTALSVGYYTPTRASLALGAVAAFLCASVAVAIAAALRYFELPASALPANLVILIMVYALKQRREAGLLLPNLHPTRSPELSARMRLLDSSRFPYLNTPALRMPCDGPRVITQGFDGKLTHRGQWRHALDFEVRTNEQPWDGSGAQLEDFATYGTPVLAPCDGVVVRAIRNVPDNEPGGNNPESNWGNFVMIHADNGMFVMMAHLKRESVCVQEGRRVASGELLGQCGNSGRSPVPHLHLQTQEAAVLGAATRPFCLAHYASRAKEGEGWVFHTAALPANGETIAPCAFDAALFATLSGWLPGEYRWHVTSEEQGSWEETLVMDFDDMGCFRVRSRRYKAGFRAFLRDHVFFCVDLEGPGQSVAALLALGLGRVPCIVPPDGGVTWSDQFSSVPFAPRWAHWMHDLLDPFTGPSLLPYRYGFGGDGSIQCELQGQGLTMEPGVPRSVKVALAPRQLATALEVRSTHDRILHAELTHYQVHPPIA
jgi:murein DD-endopeptidase MepM/ murein hydrolase activator NlpD